MSHRDSDDAGNTVKLSARCSVLVTFEEKTDLVFF